MFFTPVGKNISIIVPGKNGEISEMHYKFYQEVEQKYASLTDRIAPLLQDAFSYESAYVSLEDVWNKFSLWQIELPSVEKLNSSSFDWTIDYIYELDYSQYTIEMMNWNPMSSYYSE